MDEPPGHKIHAKTATFADYDGDGTWWVECVIHHPVNTAVITRKCADLITGCMRWTERSTLCFKVVTWQSFPFVLHMPRKLFIFCDWQKRLREKLNALLGTSTAFYVMVNLLFGREWRDVTRGSDRPAAVVYTGAAVESRIEVY